MVLLVLLTIGISLAQLDAAAKKANLHTENEKTDLSQVATSHLIRLIIIITVIPFIIVNNTGNDVLLNDNFNYLTQILQDYGFSPLTNEELKTTGLSSSVNDFKSLFDISQD